VIARCARKSSGTPSVARTRGAHAPCRQGNSVPQRFSQVLKLREYRGLPTCNTYDSNGMRRLRMYACDSTSSRGWSRPRPTTIVGRHDLGTRADLGRCERG
jgi:hypothetical protein